jgi:hypothetical protein
MSRPVPQLRSAERVAEPLASELGGCGYLRVGRHLFLGELDPSASSETELLATAKNRRVVAVYFLGMTKVMTRRQGESEQRGDEHAHPSATEDVKILVWFTGSSALSLTMLPCRAML